MQNANMAVMTYIKSRVFIIISRIFSEQSTVIGQFAIDDLRLIVYFVIYGTSTISRLFIYGGKLVITGDVDRNQSKVIISWIL